MHKNAIDISGNRYGMWTAIRPQRNEAGRLLWLFRCDCGKEKVNFKSNVISGKSVSCGCTKGSHHNSGIPEWSVWYSMVHRCTNKNSSAWDGYGGRGIGVCIEWLEFDAFIADMGSRPTSKHQLDRIDNNKGYSKGNCRWVLSLDNVRNRRDSKFWFVNDVKYESMRSAANANGVVHSTIRSWCESGKNGCYSERKYK